MSKFVSFVSICTLALTLNVYAEAKAVPAKKSVKKKVIAKKSIQPFTAKALGDRVRVRATADLDSQIVHELKKDELVVVVGEKGDFYAVEPQKGTKAYIFRGFVIDNCVEGHHVNVRLAPSRDALVIGHYSTGKKISGTISKTDSKWLEIEPPTSTKFYVAKEYLKYIGNRDMKAIFDGRKEKVAALLEKSNKFASEELAKTFQDINISKVTDNYKTIINEYGEFKAEVKEASTKLLDIQENYLRKKIAHLENQTLQGPKSTYKPSAVMTQEQRSYSSKDLMKMWEPAEEALFKAWATSHLSKDINDFYAEQKRHAKTITGTVEAYRETVFNAPGSYILKVGGKIECYLYSTQVDLSQFKDKKVTLSVQPRNNNNFAFSAYYVLDAE